MRGRKQASLTVSDAPGRVRCHYCWIGEARTGKRTADEITTRLDGALSGQERVVVRRGSWTPATRRPGVVDGRHAEGRLGGAADGARPLRAPPQARGGGLRGAHGLPHSYGPRLLYYVRQSVEAQNRARFNETTQATKAAIYRRVKADIDAMFGARGLLLVSDSVEQDEWDGYVRSH